MKNQSQSPGSDLVRPRQMQKRWSEKYQPIRYQLMMLTALTPDEKETSRRQHRKPTQIYLRSTKIDSWTDDGNTVTITNLDGSANTISMEVILYVVKDKCRKGGVRVSTVKGYQLMMSTLDSR